MVLMQCQWSLLHHSGDCRGLRFCGRKSRETIGQCSQVTCPPPKYAVNHPPFISYETYVLIRNICSHTSVCSQLLAANLSFTSTFPRRQADCDVTGLAPLAFFTYFKSHCASVSVPCRHLCAPPLLPIAPSSSPPQRWTRGPTLILITCCCDGSLSLTASPQTELCTSITRVSFLLMIALYCNPVGDRGAESGDHEAPTFAFSSSGR